MTTRKELKRKALDGLGGYYWTGFLVCVIAMLLGGAGGAKNPLSGLTGSMGSSGVEEIAGSSEPTSSMALVILGVLVTVLGTMWLVGILWSSFVGNVIQVGCCRYFVESQEIGRSAGLGQVFSGFGGGNYLNVVKVMFMRGLFQMLWTFLLIIPGIIKSYDYYLVPYLLAEYPTIDRKEAFRLSKVMMDGNKLDTWVLELSFIGWYFLGALCCCLGGVFVHPYREATLAELYLKLRQERLGIYRDR